MHAFINDFSITQIQYFNHYFFDHTHIFHGHRHDCWEINVVLEGELEVTYDDTIFTLHQNQVFIGEPNVFHRNRVTKDPTVELIVIHFSSADLPFWGTPQIFYLSDENLTLFHLLISDFKQFKAVHNISSDTVDIAPFSFKKLLEVFTSRIIKEQITLPHSTQKETLIYNKAVTYMKNNLHKNCSITEIATACCVCNTTLKNIFKKYTDQGVNTFFINMKLESSKQYLQQNYSIAQISEQLGFSSQAYFSQTFKKFYGYSPLQYKQQH
ncbi:helix-turn-helix domain-containing protein [Niameybacter massiliensis]|uniref:helix-turn-helix domain-containing protein n=1 Tax=Niameybacter massiliensis TaxID=1658108 RepID=UPI0006B4DECF|nr:AraC family transcriptional regulator [Niameybacter massiliensis]